ncbi:MAG: N-acetylmuramoyl-L-alanine amidase [Cyanobacteria bacterium SIG32]|nr:N-acetylmuramoyl-L-alanine amidase [Cyanobacteria bacterium SIG32]
MKKLFLIFIILFISIFTQFAKAEDLFKITAANFDTSNSLIVLNIQDESTQPVLNTIKLIELDNPRRAYFDIPSSILTIPKQDWNFNTKGIKEIKINQFSTDPNVVRVVMYYEEDFNPSNIKFLRLKNNLFIKINDTKLDDQYFHKTYRDEHSSASDFYEYLTVEVPDNTPQETMVDQIQQAFNTTSDQKMDEPTLVKKDLKLNTKYYINSITPRENGILLSGFGSVTIEKPLILSNPNRIVYDIPNTVVNREIRNSEHKLNETDTVKIGQFEVNKARIVITTPDVWKYLPIYSTDNQSILIAHKDKIVPSTLFTNSSDVIAYNKEKTSNQTSSMILSFNHPIVKSVERTETNLTIYLYNVARYNEETYLQTYKNTYFSKGTFELLPNIGLKYSIPTEPDTFVNTYIGADGKTLKVQITEPKRTKPVFKNGTRTIVLDPGHGGNDCGAIRGEITEKDITLDVSKRVQEILTKQGYIVHMTREDDATVSLQERVEFSEDIQPDIFVSIHVNSSEKPAITGVETHYYRQESLSLAQTVHASMASNVKANNRGLFKSKFYVINHTTSPAILVEIGFLSNAEERAELVSEKRKQATAKAIAEGVQNYFKDNK